MRLTIDTSTDTYERCLPYAALRATYGRHRSEPRPQGMQRVLAGEGEEEVGLFTTVS